MTKGGGGFEAELLDLAKDEHHGGMASWGRPAAPPLEPTKESLFFLQLEIDNYLGNASTKLLKQHPGIHNVPIIRIFGVTDKQNSVMCHVHDFLPYFYVRAPEGFSAQHCTIFQSFLEERMRGEHSNATSPFIAKIDLVMKESIYGYTGKQKSGFLLIVTSNPSYLNTAKRVLENGFTFGNQTEKIPYATFESNLPFIMRFMVDTKLTGMNYIELPARKYRIRHQSEKISTCQYEVDVSFTDFESFVPEGQYSNIPPLRILSFDIECAGRKGVFPEATLDPVIQIASMVTVQGESKPRIRNVFTLNTCGNIVGSEVFSYNKEEDLLREWSKFFQIVDADVVTGYNINNFDFPYLLDRATHLRVNQFPFLSRISASLTKARDTTFSSKAHGTRESKTFNMEGRLLFDLLQVIQRDYKLRSYSLNAVSAHFLGEQKEDVPHSIITDLQNGNEETRRRLAIYCLKDAYLPQRLLDKLMSLVNYIEMARVTGVPFNYILQRGQQIKVVSQLYRKAAEEGFLIPAMRAEAAEEQYEGATVIEPMKGYYDIPIATLDFASLYPSIMMAHNLCYTTLLDPADVTRFQLSPDQYIRTPSGDYFVKSAMRKGILPIVLEDLLAARKRAKADLKKETDPFRMAVLDGRQLALKISANSVYGFTGATVGKLPCIQISQSVTAFGRQMIQKTQELVEAKYTIENGYPSNAQVIYGDTDSVMVKFGVPDLASTMKYGREAAELVSKTFVSPIALEFEKCYFPYLLINKKRYAGLYWTNTVKWDKIDAKGIETVRRDNCRLVQTLISTCLHKILIERDVEGAKNYAKQTIADLLQNKIDMSQLVITKALSKSGEEYAGKQAHVELAEKMKKRDAGSAPALGDRVAYVICKAAKGAAAYEKSEDPIYVLEHNIPIDTKYYLENQLSKPLLRIFEPIIKNPEELLSGEHTRVVHMSAPTLGALRKFTVKTDSCMGCKAALSKTERVVCQYCRGDIGTFYLRQLSLNNDLEEKYARLWTQCQRCQGSMHQDILCTSRDCPIFYMRKKVQKDVGESAETLAKFDFEW